MRLSIQPWAIICCELIFTSITFVEDFDSAIAIFHAIFVLSQVNIFIRNVFKAKAILLALSWQICIPLSNVKSSTEVPEDILIGFKLIIHSVFEFSYH